MQIRANRRLGAVRKVDYEPFSGTIAREEKVILQNPSSDKCQSESGQVFERYAEAELLPIVDLPEMKGLLATSTAQSRSIEQNTLLVADLLRIELEQVRHDLLLVALEADAVGGLDRGIQRAVRRKQVGGHLIGVVEVGERLARIGIAGIQDRLSTVLDLGTLGLRRIGPHEVVVDDPGGIPVTTLEAPAHRAHPRVVELGLEDAVMVDGRLRHQEDQIAAKRFGTDKPHWNVLPPLR